MKTTIAFSLTLTLGSIALLTAIDSGASLPAAAPQQTTALPAGDQISITDEAYQSAMIDHRAELVQEFRRVGMEYQSAGFHIVRPATDPAWSRQDSLDSSVSLTSFRFWRAQPTPTEGYTWPDIVESSAHVSFDRAFENFFGRYYSRESTDGTWEVVAFFSARARGALWTKVSERTPSSPGRELDWAGLSRDVSEPSTPMWVTVVMEDLAQVRVDMANVAQKNATTGVEVVVARNLSEDDSTDMVKSLSGT